MSPPCIGQACGRLRGNDETDQRHEDADDRRRCCASLRRAREREGSDSGESGARAPGPATRQQQLPDRTPRPACFSSLYSKEVQATILPDAESAAFLAQLALKLDPTVIYKLSAAAVDKSTKRECPTEYERFLKQAEITSLIDVGLQP